MRNTGKLIAACTRLIISGDEVTRLEVLKESVQRRVVVSDRCRRRRLRVAALVRVPPVREVQVGDFSGRDFSQRPIADPGDELAEEDFVAAEGAWGFAGPLEGAFEAL